MVKYQGEYIQGCGHPIGCLIAVAVLDNGDTVEKCGWCEDRTHLESELAAAREARSQDAKTIARLWGQIDGLNKTITTNKIMREEAEEALRVEQAELAAARTLANKLETELAIAQEALRVEREGRDAFAREVVDELPGGIFSDQVFGLREMTEEAIVAVKQRREAK